jgi:hypothetical protein
MTRVSPWSMARRVSALLGDPSTLRGGLWLQGHGSVVTGCMGTCSVDPSGPPTDTLQVGGASVSVENVLASAPASDSRR